MDKNNSAKPTSNRPPQPKAAATETVPLAPLFRRIDWIAFGVTTLATLLGYLLTLAPDLTLEDCGELAVGSFYAGVPHPPGYPLWTIYTWLFTVLVPISNIAFRVALSSAVAAALSCGLLSLIVSRGSSMIIEGISDLKTLSQSWESGICMVSGFVAGCLLAFNGFFWSQAVIVEVYCLGVLSLMGVLCSLLRWTYAPHQLRYLYLAFFLFGLCFTNHQTLIVAAMGLEVAIMVVNPKLGRDLFLGNGLIYVVGLMMKANHSLTSFDNNLPLFAIYNVIGIGSIATCLWLVIKTKGLLTEWKALIILGALWIVGAAFYFYMPVTSMTNPPMNWGYPRTVEGFFHALTRGQYDRTKPTNDFFVLVNQLRMYLGGAIEEFNFVYLLVGLVPWAFIRRMQKREQAWMTGLLAIYLCLAFLLLILLNPTTDKQSRDLTKVFFSASYVMIAIWIGYGLTVIAAYLATAYQRFRSGVLYGAAAAAGIAVFALARVYMEVNNPLVLYTAVFGVVLIAAFILVLLVSRNQPPIQVLLVLFALMPIYTVMSHWWDNEQRGHLFGFWFGHDMFKPDLTGADGKRIYPDMARDAVLFGGTDPGRFCPTYMIFCESFIPPQKRRDPAFDRRDVYIITQNALADGTYLNYIRAHYNRSTQKDPPFFQELFHTQLLAPLDDLFLNVGARVESRRRAEGVYPPKEIYCPSADDSRRTFDDYMSDFQRRMAANQLKPGEDFRIINDKIQVSGQVSVMQINGLLTKIIFDRNPTNEFYVEESFPLDWMFPYLTPFGIIMRINREPVPEFTDEIVRKDHEFWSLYSQRMIGNWINYDTPIKDICDFAERVYLRGDFKGFSGSPKFVRDNDAQKAFSKLRSALGGLYAWRFNVARTEAERSRLLREAEFAFKQSFALCPFSPEAVFRFVPLLANLGRIDDAILLTRMCNRFDPENKQVRDLLGNLESVKNNQADANRLQNQLADHQRQFSTNSNNMQAAFGMVSDYLQLQQTQAAVIFLDQLVARPLSDVNALLTAAQVYAHLGQVTKLETTLKRIALLMPGSPEVWYDLAAAQTALKNNAEALNSLGQALTLSDQRRTKQADAKDLRQMASQDARFGLLRSLPEFQKVMDTKTAVEK
jgi:tetratricopeptide (TPR) repeat protein